MRCEKCQKEYPSRYYFKTDQICLECFGQQNPAEQERAIYNSLMKHPLTSTTFSIEGYRVIQQLGEVRGIIVRSRSLFGQIGATLQTIVGGNITMYTELCESTRDEAFEMMVDSAQKIGANAIIGVRYDTTEIMSGVTEVLCYGTAVVVEKIVGLK